MEAYSSRKFMTYIWPYIKKLLEKNIYLISQEKNIMSYQLVSLYFLLC